MAKTKAAKRKTPMAAKKKAVKGKPAAKRKSNLGWR